MSGKPNFYQRYKEVEQNRILSKTGRVFFKGLPILLLILAMAAVTFVMRKEIAEKKTELEECKKYINNTKNAADYAEALSLDEEISALLTVVEACSEAKAAILSYPCPRSLILDTVRLLGLQNGLTVTIKSYTASTGTLAFDAVASDASDVNSFIKSVSACGLFASVKYTGYTLDSVNGYAIKLVCALSEDAGKQR